MDKMKKFFDIYIPTEKCNFKCSYCYVSQRGDSSNCVMPLGHTPEEIGEALAVNRLGGICFFNFCGGGETLLGDDLLPVIKRVLQEGHYVQIVTNGTLTRRFEEIISWNPKLRERIFFKFSFHYMELMRRNLFEVYFSNIKKVREAGCSFTVELMPCDDLITYIDDIKKICLENIGALPHVTVGRDEGTKELALLSKYSKEEYKKIWSCFESEMFDFKINMFGKDPKEYCYAGEWSCSLRLDTGDVFQCNGCKKLDNIYEDIRKPLKYRPVGYQCPHTHCYNCHAYMALGVFPDFPSPTYVTMRDRVCKDGSHWITPKVYDFFNQKFSENNTIYVPKRKESRVVLIGDSIREEYGKYVREELKDLIEVVEIPENAKCSTYTLRRIHEWANSLRIGTDIDLVYWNNGLWDIARFYGDEPLVSEKEYQKNLNRIIVRLHRIFPNAKIVYATTTSIAEWKNEDKVFIRRESDVVAYNKLATDIMTTQNISVDDLYTITNQFSEEYRQDWVHFSEEGSKKLAKHIAAYIFKELHKNGDLLNTDGYTLSNIKKFFNYKIVLYGYGDYGKKIYEKLKELGVSLLAICDLQKNGQCVEDKKIISFDELCKYQKKEDNLLIIVAIKDAKIYEEVQQMIKEKMDVEVCHYSIVQRMLCYKTFCRETEVIKNRNLLQKDERG